MILALTILGVTVVFLIALLQRANAEHAALEARVSEMVKKARADSVRTSHAVVTGKVTENLAFLYPQFHYNPRDARFLGSPIDFVVFEGLDAGVLRRIVFVEVKTAKAGLKQSRAPYPQVRRRQERRVRDPASRHLPARLDRGQRRVRRIDILGELIHEYEPVAA